MNAISQGALLLVAGWTSGISVYLTIALLGISGRAGWVDLPGGLETLENPLIIAAALFVFFIEFIADKVPVMDSAWDSFHTFIRPAGALALGWMAGTEYGPVAEIFFGIVMGTVALDTHAVKATTRLAINTSPEPFSNIAASLAEHSAVLVLFWLVIRHPFWAAALVVLLLVGSFFFLRMMWRFAKKIFRRKEPATSTP